MPRSIDPSSILSGAGTLPQGSVEDSSLRNPGRDTRPLEAHIKDTSRAHMAAASGLVDAGDYYVSDEVEGALQEIGGGVSGGRTNGLLSGGTWTRAGNVLTLDAGTLALVGCAVVDLGGAEITLADGVRWVYVDEATSALASSSSAPALTGEPVLIGLVTTTAGTIDTAASVDARFFVSQVDRKPALTLRDSGVAENANAEGCFMTLESALLYLETYTTGPQVETQTILVRGVIAVAATVVLPIAGIKFIGDGPDAGFTTGASLAPMFNLDGMAKTEFRDLVFTCDHTSSTAISSTALIADLKVVGCRFEGGAQDWVTAVSLSHVAAANTGIVFRDLLVEATTIGLVLDRPQDCILENLRVAEQGSTGTHGIRLCQSGPFSGEGYTHIRNSHVTGFATAISLAGDGCTVQGVSTLDCEEGVETLGGDISISGCYIGLDSSTALTGIKVLGTTSIEGCVVECPRTSWASEVPKGVSAAGASTKVRVSDCTISGFDNGGTGAGVFIEPAAAFTSVVGCSISSCGSGVFVGQGASEVAVTGNTVESCVVGLYAEGLDASSQRTHNLAFSGNTIVGSEESGIHLYGYVTQAVISGNVVDGILSASPYDPTANGIFVESNDTHLPSYIAISDNQVLRGTEGIVAKGTSTALPVSTLSIKGNLVHHCGFAEDISADVNTYAGRGSKGIGLEFCDGPEVFGNTVEKIGIGIDNAGTEAFPDAGTTVKDVQSRGIYARNCDEVRVDNNVVRDCVAHDDNASGFVHPYGIFVEVNSVGTGANHKVRGYSLCDNRVSWASSLPGESGGGEFGIALEITQGTDLTYVNSLQHSRTCGNRVSRCRRDGIRHAVSGGASTENAMISGNFVALVCQVAAVAGQEQSGILVVGLDDGDAAAQIGGVTVSGNSVDDVGNTSSTAGSGVRFVLQRSGELRRLSASGNTILNVNDSGISFEADSGVTSGTSVLEAWSAVGNRIVNGNDGIYMGANGTGTGAGVIEGGLSANNYLEDLSSTGLNVVAKKNVSSFEVSGNIGHSVTGVLISFGLGSGTPAPTVGVSACNNVSNQGLGVVAFNHLGEVHDLSIRGNTAYDFTWKGIWLACGDDSSSISICGNNLRSSENGPYGIDVELPNGVVTALMISQNLVRLTGTGTTSMECDAVAGGTQSIVSICGNAFSGAVTGVTASGAFAPDRSQCSTNVERTSGGAGNWGPGASTFTNVFTNSKTLNNQD
jgi:hypothetical protein